MKKKFKYIIFIIAFVLPLSLSLTSCSDEFSPEDFDEYQIQHKRELLLEAIEDIKEFKGDDPFIRIHVGGTVVGDYSLKDCSVEGNYFIIGKTGEIGRLLITKYVGYTLNGIWLEGYLRWTTDGLYFE